MNTVKKPGTSQKRSAPALISERIRELGDWRGETLRRVRKLIRQAAALNSEAS